MSCQNKALSLLEERDHSLRTREKEKEEMLKKINYWHNQVQQLTEEKIKWSIDEKSLIETRLQLKSITRELESVRRTNQGKKFFSLLWTIVFLLLTDL